MKFLVFSLFLPLFCTFSFAQEKISIWTDNAPGTEGRSNEEYIKNERIYKVFQPSLTIHLPPKELSTGTAILIFPGGGYDHVTIYKEGHHVASWLNSLGIAAFVLKYRLDPEEALEDALQAMKVIKENINKWNLNPNQLGMMGFSAGGHLLLNTVSHSTTTQPNFLIPIYPSSNGIDLEGSFVANASPTFICIANDDHSTPPENAIKIYQSLKNKNISAELHIYNSGGHGFGLGKNKGPIKDWTNQCEVWLKEMGLLNISP